MNEQARLPPSPTLEHIAQNSGCIKVNCLLNNEVGSRFGLKPISDETALFPTKGKSIEIAKPTLSDCEQAKEKERQERAPNPLHRGARLGPGEANARLGCTRRTNDCTYQVTESK